MTTRIALSDPRLVAEFRIRLAAARRSLARTVATTDDELEGLAARQSRAIAEDATTGMVGDLLGRLTGPARRELDEIDAAQARLVAGTFGVCAGCHQAIGVKRLRAMPTTGCCGSCEDRNETAD